MSVLQEFLATGVFAFILIFVRIGTAFMLMPGFGDSYIPEKVRLYIALGVALSLSPLLADKIPPPMPGASMMMLLILSEFIIGLFIGTVARILVVALDVAGMTISMMSGLSNAQLFNPALSGQGSVFGTFLSITGVMFIFSSNLHHMLIVGLLDSYNVFEVGFYPNVSDMAELISIAVASTFRIGIQLALPFVAIGLLSYIGMGILSRLMPQIQVFMVAIPGQILMAFITLSLVLGTTMMVWVKFFEDSMMRVFGGG